MFRQACTAGILLISTRRLSQALYLKISVELERVIKGVEWWVGWIKFICAEYSVQQEAHDSLAAFNRYKVSKMGVGCLDLVRLSYGFCLAVWLLLFGSTHFILPPCCLC